MTESEKKKEYNRKSDLCTKSTGPETWQSFSLHSKTNAKPNRTMTKEPNENEVKIARKKIFESNTTTKGTHKNEETFQQRF